MIKKNLLALKNHYESKKIIEISKKMAISYIMDNEELVDARGGWTPGKLEYKPLFEFPPKPIALLKWLFNYPDGFIFPWAAIHFLKHHGNKVLITSIPCIEKALNETAGTIIRN